MKHSSLKKVSLTLISLKILISPILISFFSIGNAWSHSVAEKASTFIIIPENGAQLSSPFLVKFGIKHFKISPAGENIHKAGHYHLLIDQTAPLSMNEPIPSDYQHLHFNQGEKETQLSLPAGKHTLQLVVGDEEHEAFEELISSPITIYVIPGKTHSSKN